MNPSARRTLHLFVFLLILALAGLNTWGPEASGQDASSENVEAVADQLEYRRSDKKIIARGNVVVTYHDIKLTADYAEVETETKKAYAKGHVLMIRGDQLAAKGEEAYYDFGKDQGQFPNGQSIEGPWFANGRVIEQTAKGKLKIEDAGVTTCDLKRPHYQIRARHVKVYSGDKIIARNITFHILGRKVFWWPYMVIPLQPIKESPIQIQPGYSSEYGGYILTSKGFSIFKWLWGKWHADWRAKRGFGAGLDFDYHFDRFRTDGLLRGYLTQDRRAPTPGLANPYSSREDRDRGRFTWKQRTDLNPDSYLLLRYQRLADEFFLQDFFEREFRSDIEPTSFVNFTANSDRHGFYAFNQARVNQFENVTERLPEIRFDWKNAPFLSDRLYYESASSLANFNQKSSRSDSGDHNLRFDTFHEWSLPLKWKEIKLTPSANIRETLYGRDKDEADELARTAFGAALDLRTHFYRIFDTSSSFLGIEINQLRHVFEPSIRYDSILHSSTSNEELFEFDSIDAIDDSNQIKFGIENRIQTKRVINGKMKRVDVVSLNTFLTYDFHPDQEYSKGAFSIWSAELEFRPYEWLQFEIRYEYDMVRDQFREFSQDLLARKGRFHILIGHRFVGRRDFIGARGNNQFVLDTGWWLNERWKIGGYIRWDAEDHELEEWEISATRDLHDFLLDLGYNVRNSEIDSSNKEFFFLLRLKAFPGFPLKSGHRASFSEPRIGTTVAGSSQTSAPTPIEA